MMFDVIEKNNIECHNLNTRETIHSLHKNLESGISPENGIYASSENTALNTTLAESFAFKSPEQASLFKETAFQTVKGMYNGTDIYGNKGLGLKEISEWKVNDSCKYANLKQHAGYSAEVISTAKENLTAKVEGTGVRSYRIDDLPDSIRQKTGDRFALKNDQYVDRIRIKTDGSYETIQTKFVGKNSAECFSKLKSKNFEKYIADGKVDKLEVPKDYYDSIKNEHIPNEKTKLQKQFDKLSSNGETEKAASVENRIKNLNKIDQMLEQSTVSSEEALFATEHPKLYSAKLLAGEANRAGLEGAKEAAVLTFAVSSVDNIYQYTNGEISGKEALSNVAKDTAISGGVGYASGALSSLTGSNIPAAAITLGVTSYDDVKDYMNGEIDGAELAYDLGRNTVSVAGGAVGATIGASAGPVGSFVGGMAGTYVATQAYDASADFITENKDTIVEFSSTAIEHVGDAVENIADAVGNKLVDAQEIVSDLKDTAVEKLNDVKDAASDLKDDAIDKMSDLKDSIASKFKK